MAHSFVAYIDESGDDGLRRFRSTSQDGSSRWLVISCCVVRYIYDLQFVQWRDEISHLMPGRKKREIHFRELTHSQKLIACQKIAKFPLRAISVMSDKTTIRSGIYTQKNQLYHYITRYLVERISWFCRDSRPRVPEGDGRVKIIFSRRGGMDYDDFKEYLRTLQRNSDSGENIQIYWPVIDIEAVEAKDHSTKAGLQIADCISSAFRMAVDPDEFGNCESRYARELKSVCYGRNGNYLSYGVKPLPLIHSGSNLSSQQHVFFTYFGFMPK